MSDSRDTNAKSITLSISGLWGLGWLFAIGYANLGFGRALLALFIWPYFIGDASR